jgi:carbonic anhydrase
LIPGSEALARLREGNRRFVSGAHDFSTTIGESRRLALAQGQEPFAVILGCADSRVPAEIVFGQGLGDLFVIRVAGNVVAPSQIGSVEFAAARLHARLVVVLGHTQCGAIAATLEQLRQPAAQRSPHLQDIVDRIRPAVEPLLATPLARQPDALAAEAVRANVRTAVSQLRHGSAILAGLMEREGLLIVGAEYSLATGVVEFFDGIPGGG